MATAITITSPLTACRHLSTTKYSVGINKTRTIFNVQRLAVSKPEYKGWNPVLYQSVSHQKQVFMGEARRD